MVIMNPDFLLVQKDRDLVDSYCSELDQAEVKGMRVRIRGLEGMEQLLSVRGDLHHYAKRRGLPTSGLNASISLSKSDRNLTAASSTPGQRVT